MFRELRRKKKAITKEECIEVLKSERRGVLSVLGDEGYPYGIPMNHYYCPDDGHLYFHGAKEGHKVDSIKKCDKISYCVFDEGYVKPGEWAKNVKCVVIFGRIRAVTDGDKVLRILRDIAHKFTDDEAYIDKEINAWKKDVLCLEIVPEHISGKLVTES